VLNNININFVIPKNEYNEYIVDILILCAINSS
jgi:hypothetical protein